MKATKQPRIQPIDVKLEEPIKSKMRLIFPENIPAPALYRTVARNESLFIDMIEMKLIGPTGLLDRKTIPAKIREILILRTCITAKNDYEFNLHIKTLSEKMGVSKEQIRDIQNESINSKLWSNQEKSLIILVDGLVKQLKVEKNVFNEVKLHFDESEMIELVQLIGLYTGVSMMVALVQPEIDQY
jgi:alkylhydroperoxidase family enzyme